MELSLDLTDWYFNINSSQQMQEFIYNFLKVTPIKERNDKGNLSVDETIITYYAEHENIKFCALLLAYRKLLKAKNTYLADIFRNINNDWLAHVDLWLNTVETTRSCIAKGTYIDCIRDVSKYPKGIKIENIKAGDHVYCFDDKLKPQIKKVLWAGKTGYRKVIRIHWQSANGKKGYLDLTPEHKVRTISGDYIQAKNLLLKDLRTIKQSKYTPKHKVLSLSRNYNELFFTRNATKHNKGIKEHRFIYKQLIGTLNNNEIIHHKDNNHLNNCLYNLQKTTYKEHGSIHYSDTLGTEISRKNNKIKVKQMWKDGILKAKSGFDHPQSLKLTKNQCLIEILKSKGSLTKSKYSYSTLRFYASLYKIDYNKIRYFYNKDGKFLSKKWIKSLINKGYNYTQIYGKLKINAYKLSDLLQHYNLQYKKIWRNQYSEGKLKENNHIITKIEHINKYVDVYDLEIEDCHNFIANEICVHNSSSNFNVQNQPKHGEIITGLPWKLLRKLFTTKIKKDWFFAEVDYDGAEMKVAGIVSDDPQLIEDLNNDFDFHSHWAIELFGLKEKDHKEIKRLYDDTFRFVAKNNFTFADIYKAHYTSIAREMRKIPFYKEYVEKQFNQLSNRKKGFDKFFIDFSEKQVENCQNARKERYPVFTAWQDNLIKKYYAKGYVESPFGYRRNYPLKEQEIVNHPIQNVSFILLLDALIRVEEEQEKDDRWKSHLIFQVHDSGVAEVYKYEACDFIDMVDEKMCDKSHIPWATKVKLKSDWKLGKNWLEMFNVNKYKYVK